MAKQKIALTNNKSFTSTKTCPFCKKRFKPKRANQIYDSPNCRKRSWDKKHLAEIMLELLSHSSDVEKAIKKIMEGK